LEKERRERVSGIGRKKIDSRASEGTLRAGREGGTRVRVCSSMVRKYPGRVAESITEAVEW
jgi:hypothetical protein